MEEDINSEIENSEEDEGGLEDGSDKRVDNRGKPVGFLCWNPKSPKRVHNTVLVDYIDHGRGYLASHCGSYSHGCKIGYLRFHTPKDYAQIKNPKPGDWIYYKHKIHPGLKPHQRGFWYAYMESGSNKVEVHNGIFDYVTLKSAPDKRIYSIKEARAHRKEIKELHYTHYILDPSNPNDIVYRPHSTTPNQKVIDLGLLPAK